MTMDDLLVRPSPSPSGAPPQPGPGTSGRPNERGRHDGAWKRWSASARGTWERLAAWDHFDALLLVALVVLALGLRWRTMWASYWGDEAIAIGIASHPVASLPHYLANDGSPPLFYLMLHYWMELFGRSTPATHALSMIGGLLAIPAAWWSGERLFGRRAARGAAALVATCAYLDYYSTETRMYSWLVLRPSWPLLASCSPSGVPGRATGWRPPCLWPPLSTCSITAYTCWRRPSLSGRQPH